MIHVKGIGKWTAEMFLVLTLGQKDILAVDDVGIQRAAQWLYGIEKEECQTILLEREPLWKPYQSIASHYLWTLTELDWMTKYESINVAE